MDIKYNFTIHCSEDSTALEYAIKNEIPYKIINNLADYDELGMIATQKAYAYVSYSADMQERADKIFSALEEFNCSFIDGSKLENVEEVIEAVNECSCFIVLVSQRYISGKEINFLRMASKIDKPMLIYILEACKLPKDLEIAIESQQQLRYDTLNEEQRIAKLVKELQKYGCRSISADIPDFDYTATTMGGINLTKYTGRDNDVVVPHEYGGLPVTSIGERAFDGCRSLTSITIPNSVTNIGFRAFDGCSSLTSITISDSVMSIGDDALCGRIGKRAFDGCSSLTSITIPNGVTSIDDYAFCGCSSLTSITIPNSVTNIGFRAFDGCSSLTSITISDSAMSIGDDALCGRIGKRAFDGCSSLTSITIPNGVTSIDDYAFCGCNSLTSITIPNSVTSIGDEAFYECSSLTSITISDSVMSIGDDALCGRIGERAFYGCSSLTSITIPNGVTSIDDDAFYGCSSLTSITIPNSVTSIGDDAFDGCRNLNDITIPGGVAVIGDWAFAGCENITVYSPKNSHAWQYCEENEIKHKSLSVAPTSRKNSTTRWLIPPLILLALAAAAGLQLSGLVDILGLLGL